MNTQTIRNIIREAVAIEKASGNLATIIAQTAMLRGVQLSQKQLQDTVIFIQQYIEHVPALLDQLYSEVKKRSLANQVKPILDAAEQYFLAPVDLIPDQYGLLGLVDDAYLANTLIQEISNRYQDKKGNPIFPLDITKANMFIRGLFDVPTGMMLDAAVANVLNGPTIQQSLQNLFNHASVFEMSQPDPIWGNASISEVVDAQLGAWGVV